MACHITSKCTKSVFDVLSIPFNVKKTRLITNIGLHQNDGMVFKKYNSHLNHKVREHLITILEEQPLNLAIKRITSYSCKEDI